MAKHARPNGPFTSGAEAKTAMRPDQKVADASSVALATFAEEFGRIMARQLLAGPNRRRGYGLPEGLVGLAFNAVMLLLAYCLMAWLRR